MPTYDIDTYHEIIYIYTLIDIHIFIHYVKHDQCMNI